MFGRKKQKHGLFNMMDNSRVTVYDFMRRYQYESYRSVDYIPYHRLCEEEMKPILDEHLEAMFAGEVDDGNGDMLDNIIFGPYRESVPYLATQRLDHNDIDRRLIARRKSDRDDFASLGEGRRAELKELEKEYCEVCKQIDEMEG